MADSTAQAHVRIELVDTLPGGRTCFPVENDQGQFTWLVRRGEMSEALAAEMAEYLNYIVGEAKRWEQNWDGSAGEPPHIGKAS